MRGIEFVEELDAIRNVNQFLALPPLDQRERLLDRFELRYKRFVESPSFTRAQSDVSKRPIQSRVFVLMIFCILSEGFFFSSGESGMWQILDVTVVPDANDSVFSPRIGRATLFIKRQQTCVSDGKESTVGKAEIDKCFQTLNVLDDHSKKLGGEYHQRVALSHWHLTADLDLTRLVGWGGFRPAVMFTAMTRATVNEVQLCQDITALTRLRNHCEITTTDEAVSQSCVNLLDA